MHEFIHLLHLTNITSGKDFSSRSVINNDWIINIADAFIYPSSPFVRETLFHNHKVNDVLIYFVKSLFNIKFDHKPFDFFNFPEINDFICNQYGIHDLSTSSKSHFIFDNGIGESLFKPISENFCQKLVKCSSQTNGSIIRRNGAFIFLCNKSYESDIHSFVDDAIFMKIIENVANIIFYEVSSRFEEFHGESIWVGALIVWERFESFITLIFREEFTKTISFQRRNRIPLKIINRPQVVITIFINFLKVLGKIFFNILISCT